MMGGKPTYDLEHLQQLVAQGDVFRSVTEAAQQGAGLLGWGVPEVVAAVLELKAGDFYKTMEAERCPGLWQDVYRLAFRGIDVYVKLQLARNGRAVVVQFKRK